MNDRKPKRAEPIQLSEIRFSEPAPLKLSEFLPDTQQIGQGVIESSAQVFGFLINVEPPHSPLVDPRVH